MLICRTGVYNSANNAVGIIEKVTQCYNPVWIYFIGSSKIHSLERWMRGPTPVASLHTQLVADMSLLWRQAIDLNIWMQGDI
jgi:hypothetical protein